MAIVYAAQLRPSKMELLAAWLPQQPWFAADAAQLVSLGSFRFDDPDGEVGVESHFLSAGQHVFHVPLTYRGTPLEGAEAFLVGTMEHSVLGHRWVYDATGDPVYAATLSAAIFTGKPQAVQLREVDGVRTVLSETATIAATGVLLGSAPALSFLVPVATGSVTTISCGGVELCVLHVLDPGIGPDTGHGLTGVWDGQDSPVLFATATAA
ncbi:hypothetical protein AAGW05_02860 [Arthrobacter sp. LAPM80]|uniref:CG0192-related protein n=1 Tax=Arthrobacter sp. LAPM80 TaxID=3141788 RepID=UPI00398AFA5D